MSAVLPCLIPPAERLHRGGPLDRWVIRWSMPTWSSSRHDRATNSAELLQIVDPRTADAQVLCNY